MRNVILSSTIAVIVVGLVATCVFNSRFDGQSKMETSRKLPGQNEVFAPATELEIQKFEAKFDLKLPPHYRNFLRTVNGGAFARCRLDTTDVEDDIIRPAPYGQWLQYLRTLAEPQKSTVSLFHDDGWLEIIREGEDVLLKIGLTEDGGILFIYVVGEHADEVWLKTPDGRNYDGKEYESSWFFLGRNIHDFLKRLRYESAA